MKLGYVVRGLAASFAAALIVSLAGCSSDGGRLLSTVPSGARVVADVSADALLREAGCRVGDDGVSLSASLDSLLAADGGMADVREFVTSGTVDLQSVVWFSMDGRSGVITAGLKDAGAFRDRMAAGGVRWTGDGDFDVAVTPSGEATVVIRDSQLWICDGRRDASYIEDILAKAGDKPIGKVPAVAKALKRNGQVRVVASVGSGLGRLYDKPEYQDCWLTGALSAKGAILSLDMGLVASDGRKLEFASGLDRIDPGFLDFMSPHDVLVAAVGVDGDTNWPAIVTALSPLMSRGDAMTLSALTPYLSKIDGTLAVGISPVGGAPRLSSVSAETLAITVVAKMKRGQASRVADDIRSFLSKSHMPMDEDGDMTQAVTPMGTFRFGERDGYFIATNREMPGSGARGLEARFLGKRFGICADVAYGSGLMQSLGLPFGLTATLVSTDDAATAKVELAGVSGGILEALIAEAAKNSAR